MLSYLLLVTILLEKGVCQDCAQPTDKDLMRLLKDGGNSTGEFNITLYYSQIVCRAYGRQKDLLRLVSVVVEYTCSGHKMCQRGTVLEQIESECIAGHWANTVLGSTDYVRSTATQASLTVAARDDCSFCLSPELAANKSLKTDSVTHCVGEQSS